MDGIVWAVMLLLTVSALAAPVVFVLYLLYRLVRAYERRSERV